MDNGLSKEERICSVKAVEALIAGGRHVCCEPLRCCWYTRQAQDINRIMISVPKRLFKRAVKRNLLKRRIREAYRLQKHQLESRGIDMMFVYTSKEVADFQTIFASMQTLLGIISNKTGDSSK